MNPCLSRSKTRPRATHESKPPRGDGYMILGGLLREAPVLQPRGFEGGFAKILHPRSRN